MTKIYNWQGFKGIEAGFYGRAGGALVDQAVLLKQTHSARCLRIQSAQEAIGQEGDALVTDVADLVLAVKTADCAPVLFASKDEEVIGVAHAGWRGAIGGVIEATINAMNIPSAQIKACVGPCIARRSYEVDEAFFKQFIDQDERYESCFHAGARAGHYQFDLEGFCALRLYQAGVTDVTLAGLDTYTREADFFSYRRATHQGTEEKGRQLSVIVKRG